jgi:hypothetical protein
MSYDNLDCDKLFREVWDHGVAIPHRRCQAASPQIKEKIKKLSLPEYQTKCFFSTIQGIYGPTTTIAKNIPKNRVPRKTRSAMALVALRHLRINKKCKQANYIT